jgi:hypothetical protein
MYISSIPTTRTFFEVLNWLAFDSFKVLCHHTALTAREREREGGRNMLYMPGNTHHIFTLNQILLTNGCAIWPFV